MRAPEEFHRAAGRYPHRRPRLFGVDGLGSWSNTGCLVTATTALRAQGASSRPKAPLTAAEEPYEGAVPPTVTALWMKRSHREGHAILHASFGAPLCIHQAIRVKLRYERRDLKTFCADCSKQAGQQMLGGALMVGMGLMLAKESGLDALAWYGAQYPFEIVLTTVFTGGAVG